MVREECEKPRERISVTGLVIKPVGAVLKQMARDSFGGRPNTVIYPKERLVLPTRYRGKHALSFKRCIGCGSCVEICPNECMWMKKIDDPALGKIERPGVDYGRCLFCGLCVEICPTDALLMTTEYELSVAERDEMRHDPEAIRNDAYPVHEPKQSVNLPFLDLDKCKGKGECAKVCPVKCIKLTEVEKTGKTKPEIELSICTHCGKCAEACPEKALEMRNKTIVMFELRMPKFTLENCSGCAACQRTCPADAIYMMDMPGTEKKKADGSMTKAKKRAVFVLEKCTGCGRCAATCKFDSLEMVPESQWKTAPPKKKKEKKGGEKK